MAKAKRQTKARRSGKTARKGSRRKSRRTPFSWPAIKRRLWGWLDHSASRFSLGIGIGLAIGLLLVVLFGHFGHWLGIQRQPADDIAGLINNSPVPPRLSETPKARPEPETPKPVTEAAPAVEAKPTINPTTSNPPVPKDAAQGNQAAAAPENMSEITEQELVPQLTRPPAILNAPPPPTAQPSAAPGPKVAQKSTDTGTKPNDQPAWLRNSVAMRAPVNGPMIAIVLDDVGVAKAHAEMAIDLPAPITLSMMTYADGVAEMAAEARAKGHELMLHVPMQPVNPNVNPGPHALLVGLSPAELKQRLDWGLDRFSGFIGINNHMGSRFTQDDAGMRVVMQELRARGLLFLDSKTISNSVGDKLAREMGVAHVARDVFLDDDMSPAAVARQLAITERVARKQGYAVAIGHPHPATLAVLKKWLIDAKQRGFVLVPLSTIARRENGLPG
ncbi:divergent polysaccharide deacetylase family protein [Dongia soli]|uniref:Divergent polysaccharide deacetylase family protein n=1 Tax=Dongia soli TaxID=600628 RepID=A0ABU5E9M7_9PROT|nr:divergent polysaccharide deacetylase family protein [Dongia soli]MDY0883051.1 divergent polysaccharide deacetylase family protein [Dongia soli]